MPAIDLNTNLTLLYILLKVVIDPECSIIYMFYYDYITTKSQKWNLLISPAMHFTGKNASY